MTLIGFLSPVILPNILRTPQSVLDVGCGSGRTLAALAANDCRLVGLDSDLDVLRRVDRQTHAHFICGTGEALPFPDSSFDLVISKLALPYMNIPIALREINRVMKPDAKLFLTLHPIQMAWHRILVDLTLLRFR